MKFDRPKPEWSLAKTDVTFKDGAGIVKLKEDLKEIVMFLKDPRRFLLMGARFPKGALFVEPPGSGKTLLARL
jgi:cell division protease FtsH